MIFEDADKLGFDAERLARCLIFSAAISIRVAWRA